MNLSLLRNSFYTINDIFAERQFAIEKSWFERTVPRPSDALLLFNQSTAIYRSPNQSPLYVPHGALVYIPRGCTYSIESHCISGVARIEILLFEFNLIKTDFTRVTRNKILISQTTDEKLDLGSNGIEIIDFKPKLYERYFTSLIDAFESKNASPISIYRSACAILECIIHNHISDERAKNGNGIVDLALEYLGDSEKNEKSIAEIAEICCVSVSGFEKIFRRMTGMTPSAYRLECKLAQVKQLLYKHPELSLESVADLCGFDDASYLCRVFKKKFGIPPRKYQYGYRSR